MKRFLLFGLTLMVSVGVIVAAPMPKEKTVKIVTGVEYNGLALKKQPLGNGALTLDFCGTLSGVFNDLKVSNGKLDLQQHEYVITGDFSMIKTEGLDITIKNGKFNGEPIMGEAKMSYKYGIYVLSFNYAYTIELSNKFMGEIKPFVGENQTYNITDCDGVAQYRIDNKDKKSTIVKKATRATITFKSGAVVKVNFSDNSYELTIPNGDFISVKSNNVANYKITRGNSVIEAGKVTHTFENGNKYIGAVKGEFADYLNATDINTLHSFKGLTWTWADFKKYAGDGTLIYADGKSDNVIGGTTETEIKALEAEKKALRANDKFVADANGKITSCTITYRDGVVFHYSAANKQCEYVYKNGDKMGLCAAENFTKEKYEKMLTDLTAPAITDLKHDATYRHFANGYKITNNDEYLTTPKQKNGDYITYELIGGKFVPESWQKTINGNVYVSTKMNLPSGDSVDACYVKFANQKVFLGSFGGFYENNPNNSVAKNASISALGINVVCGLEDIKSVSLREGVLCANNNGEDSVEALYFNGTPTSYQEMIDRGASSSYIDNYLKTEKSKYVYRMLANKYDADVDKINYFFQNARFATDTPIGFVRDITAYFAAGQYSPFKKVESVQGSVRKLTIVEGFAYDGQVRWGVDDKVIGEFSFDAKSGKLVSYRLDNRADAWSYWYNELGLLDAFKIRNLL